MAGVIAAGGRVSTPTSADSEDGNNCITCAAARGKYIRTVVPRPGALASVTCPFDCITNPKDRVAAVEHLQDAEHRQREGDAQRADKPRKPGAGPPRETAFRCRTGGLGRDCHADARQHRPSGTRA